MQFNMRTLGHKRTWSILLLCSIAVLTLKGQSSIASLGTEITQDFNTLTSGTWTNNSTLTGWYARTTSTASITSYGANTGSTTTAGLYAFGVAGTNPLTDRALGFTATNSYTGNPGSGFVGWRLLNNTGGTIDTLTVTWSGEQWRRNNNAAAQSMTLTYQTGSSVTDLISGTWTTTTSLFTSPITGTGTAVLDGNAPANRTGGITIKLVVSLPAGHEIMLRWVDPNDSGEDHHMAIDDVRVVATAAGASPVITVDTSFNFGNQTVNTTSAIRQYPVSGSNLVEGIGVKAPDGFQVALSAGGSYSDSITLPAGGGTVYLRFAPVAVAAYSGQVIHSSSGASDKLVAVSGTGTAPDNPVPFTATANGSYQIDLTASANTNGNDILVAFNSTNSFGTPSGSYAAGNAISGGGTVHYAGNAAGLTSHTGLSPSQTVYYKAWSVDASGFYSSGTEANATTDAIPPSGPQSVMLAGWDFNGLTSYGPSPFNPTFLHSDVAAIGLTRGSGVGTTGSAASNAWGGVAWNVANAAAAISGGKFATFSLSAKPGYRISLSSIDPYNIRRSSTGASTGQWQYSLDGIQYTDLGSEITWGSVTSGAGNPQTAIDLTSLSTMQRVENGTSIHFRLLSYGASASTGTWYLNQFQADEDLVLMGHAEPIPDTSIFTGTGSWSDTAHWSNGIPGSVTHVIMEGSATLDHRARIRSIAFATGGVLTINAGDTLFVSGDWHASTTGSLVVGPGTVCFSGNAVQNVGGVGPAIFDNLVVDNMMGVQLGTHAIVYETLDLRAGKIITNTYEVTLGIQADLVNCSSATYVQGTLNRAVPLGNPTLHYCIGDSTAYAPVSLSFTGVTVSGTVAVSTIGMDHPNIGGSGLDPQKTANRYWQMNDQYGIGFASYNATFFYGTNDLDAGAQPLHFQLKKWNGASWNATTLGTRTATTMEITNETSFSDFQAGEACVNPEVPVLNAPQTSLCTGGSVLIQVQSGQLNSAAQWVWYADSCGGTPLGTGTSLSVTPGATTTYFVRGEGGCAADGLCGQITIQVFAQPAGPSLLSKTPDLPGICQGQQVSALFNAGTGGVGCSDAYRFSVNNGVSWADYAPGNLINTSTATIILIQGRRAGCTNGSGCTGTTYATLATWTAYNQPSAPSVVSKSPNLTAVCEGQDVSATLSAGTGGIGCTDTFRVTINNGLNWATYTSGSTINTTGGTVVIIQGMRHQCDAQTGCSGTAWVNLAQWSINAHPTRPALSVKSPDLMDVCEGQGVSATFLPGSGGVGCSDSFRYSVDSGASWNPYTPGQALPTLGIPSLMIQGGRMGCTTDAGCTPASYTELAFWRVHPQPVGPVLLLKDPDLLVASEGVDVKATFNPGSGGIGCADTFRYSINNGNAWFGYMPGVEINTTGSTVVLIQGARAGCDAGTGCQGTQFTTLASWVVNAPPVAPTLSTKIPDVADVCEYEDLSAAFLPGDGGVGCSDTFRFSIDAGQTWQPYTPGQIISVAGPAVVIIEGMRGNCISGIPTAYQTLATWNVYPYTNVGLTLPFSEICQNAAGVKLTGGWPLGGTYSGPGVNNNNFYPALLAPGPYQITYSYRNANNCLSSASDQVQVNPVPAVSLPPMVFCDNAGLVNLSSGSPAGGTYSGIYVSMGKFDVSAAGLGQHPVSYSYKDGNGCQVTLNGMVTVVPLPQVSIASAFEICADALPMLLSGGSPAGGTWSGPGVSAGQFDPSGLIPGVYQLTYTYTDGNGCTDAATTSMTVHALPVADAGPDRVICRDECVQLMATGGVQYLWSTLVPTQGLLVCPPVTMTFAVTVTDAHGCQDTDDVLVTVKPVPDVIQGSQELCPGSCVSLTAPVGVSYAWSHGLGSGSTVQVCPQQTTTYTVTVTNAVQCSKTSSFQVATLPVPPVNAGPDVSICAGDAVTLTATGGISYQWSGGSPSNTAAITVSPVVTTTYTVTATGGNGCTAQDQVVVNTRPLPVVTVSPATAQVCAGSCVTLSAGGGVAYQWSTGAVGSQIQVCPQVTTTYVVTVTGSNGCKTTGSREVTVHALPLVNAGPDGQVVIGGSHTFSQATATGYGTLQYLWAPALTLNNKLLLRPTATPVATTTYTLHVTDGRGCIATDQAEVVVLPLGNTLSGQVVYDNAQQTPLPGFQVILTSLDSKYSDTIQTGAQGLFYLTNIPAGTYVISGTSNQQWGWGGVNATDALLALRHFVQLDQLTGIKLQAGDVNMDHAVNSTDGLLIGQRFSGLIQGFPSGNWILEADTFVLAGNQMFSGIFKVLCAGDMNGSFTPLSKNAGVTYLGVEGELEMATSGSFEIPLMVNQAVLTGAISLVLDLPAGIVPEDVRLGDDMNGHLHYAILGRQVRIAWFDVDGAQVQERQPLFWLKIRMMESSKTIGSYQASHQEIVDESGHILPGAKLLLPALVNRAGEFRMEVFPNPVQDQAVLHFFLPKAGYIDMDVMDVLGARVLQTSSGYLADGRHQIQLDGKDWPAGIYHLRIRYKSEDHIWYKTIRLQRIR